MFYVYKKTFIGKFTECETGAKHKMNMLSETYLVYSVSFKGKGCA